jgi:hypothetical protein
MEPHCSAQITRAQNVQSGSQEPVLLVSCRLTRRLGNLCTLIGSTGYCHPAER